ncbi:ankyrin repeat domain-containing protein [Winogradskyella sp. F6397]|uniref:Ankyrin repeat domain-containing protein n=1 Tax=Winogradskyella marina TaxID=2785530 RepID=A0ABS0EHZ6_9FLAO|nr:ankyrin repeat domain-containing protein [Winogradskyella marina]MBF8150064.1 ankyrin repeat domain-containing protein [Winogradskyella marina]
MKNLKLSFVAILLALSFQGFAQDNVFLDRAFWDTKPTVAALESKIKEGNNPAEANSNNFDGVVYATLQDAPLKSIIYLISQKGNDVNKLTHDGRTYIFWAAYKGNDALVDYLLKNDAKTNITDDKGNTIINFAAGSGQANTKVYDRLIKHNADLINKINPDGANALLLAAPSDKDFKLIKYFQSKGLDINSVDNSGNGIFNYVAKSGNTEILNSLLKQGIKGTHEAFIFAAHGMRRQPNDIGIYKYLERVGLQPNVTNSKGETPLHILAYNSDNTEVLNYLLDKGLDVNQADHNGNTPFINAASRNKLEVVKRFAKNVKDINATNKKGESALALAVKGNATNTVAYLLEEGAKSNSIDSDGNNLVYYVINSYSEKNKEEFTKKLDLLKSHGLDLTAVQKNGNNWFHLTVEKNSISLLKLALEFNQDINAKNKDGNTPLHLAALKATDDVVLKFLVKNGAKKEIVTDFEESAYDLAIENELLKKNNISVEFLK